RHTRFSRDWSSDVCSSDLDAAPAAVRRGVPGRGGHGVQEAPRQAWRHDGERLRRNAAQGLAIQAGCPCRRRERGRVGPRDHTPTDQHDRSTTMRKAILKYLGGNRTMIEEDVTSRGLRPVAKTLSISPHTLMQYCDLRGIERKTRQHDLGQI